MTLTSVNNFPRLINTQGQCAVAQCPKCQLWKVFSIRWLLFSDPMYLQKKAYISIIPELGLGDLCVKVFLCSWIIQEEGWRKESFLGAAVSDNTAPHPISVARPQVIPSSLTSFCLSQEKRGVYTLMWYFLPVPSTLFMLCMWTSCLFSLSHTVSKSKFTLSVFDLFLF